MLESGRREQFLRSGSRDLGQGGGPPEPSLAILVSFDCCNIIIFCLLKAP